MRRQRCIGKAREEQRTKPSKFLERRMEVNRGRISREDPNCDQGHARGHGPIMYRCPQGDRLERMSNLIGQEEDRHGKEEDVS